MEDSTIRLIASFLYLLFVITFAYFFIKHLRKILRLYRELALEGKNWAWDLHGVETLEVRIKQYGAKFSKIILPDYVSTELMDHLATRSQKANTFSRKKRTKSLFRIKSLAFLILHLLTTRNTSLLLQRRV